MKRFKKSKDIRVAVIGYGAAGARRMAAMRDAGMTPVAAVEPSDQGRAAALAAFPGIAVFPELGGLLKKGGVDLVTIVTPHNTHASLAVACMKAGIHVVCEKPMAITTRECDSMIAASLRYGVMLTVHHNRHWDGCILKALEQVKKQHVIGDITRIEAGTQLRAHPGNSWRSSRSQSGGILYDWGVHLLEFIFQLVDSDVTEVSGFSHEGFWAGQTNWKKDTNEDEAHAVIRFKNGVMAELSASQINDAPRPDLLEITGTLGRYCFSEKTFTLSRTDESGARVTESGTNPPSQFPLFYRNVTEHLTRGVPLVISPEWARLPVQVLDLAALSAAKGRSVPFKQG